MTETLTAADGFLRTVVDFIVRHDGEWVPEDSKNPSSRHKFQQSEIAQHVTECGVKEIFDVGQDLKLESASSRFAPGAKPELTSWLKTNFNCNCGQYALINIKVRNSINSIMYEIKNGPLT